jgi:hypothetical protein
MKTRTFVSILILVLAVLIISGSCATRKKVLPTDNIDELVGTWLNPDYEGRAARIPKFTIKADRTILWYASINDKEASYNGKITEIGEKWMERDGSIYYKLIVYDESFVSTAYFLVRLSPDRSFFEEVYRANPPEYPSEFDPEDTKLYYRIWYRQE